MSKLCYVIMPYGSDDETSKKRFKSIFSAIIKPAAESKGYNVIREDHEARQGSISANIVKSLAEADLVIADLSQNNWNVAYELGIRHALNKNGTVLIVDNKTPLMFDIQGNKVIHYSYEWYDCIDEVQQQIVDSIKYIEDNKTSSDSPVHDIYPSFSRKLIDYLTDNNDQEKAMIAALTQENAKLKETLDNAGLSADVEKPKSDIVTSFRDAIGRSQYSGAKALVKLQEKLNDEEEFVSFLAEALNKGFFSESNFDSIFWMCHKLDNYFVTIAFLEEIVRRYPDNEEFSGRLAREYAKSFENREKAVLTVNKNVGIKKVNGKFVAERKTVSHNVLASFFDVYITLDKYSEMKDIALILLEIYPKHSDLINRNLVTAYNGLDEYSESERIAKELVKNNPTALNHYSLYKVYRAIDEHSKAYEQVEACIETDPDDADYNIIMAGLILDSYYIRTVTGYNSEVVRVSKQQAVAAAIPFVFKAYENNYGSSECIAFLQKNSLHEAAKIVYMCASKQISEIPRSEDFDYYPLDYILDK